MAIPTLAYLALLCTSYVFAYAKLSDQSLLHLPGPGKDFDINNGPVLSPILRPRVPGTPGSTAVLQHFVDFFRTSLPEWKLDFQNSSSETPTSRGKKVPFVNLIASRDPPGTRPGEVGRLTLVAHYDSLSSPHGFIGAIDSAAPCAMLMHAARSIDQAMTQKWDKDKDEQQDFLEVEGTKGIQLIFMDGEEAFLHWNDQDSIYGARALAEHWEQSPMPAGSTRKNALESVDLFVLLDLLGAENTEIPSWFLTTHWAYQAMADIEERMRRLNQFQSSPNHPSKAPSQRQREPTFLPEKDKDAVMFRPSYMGDDHLPFETRGVEILHLIPSSFPSVWHTMQDDGEHLDSETVDDWAKLITAFAAEWMELDQYMPRTPSPRDDKEDLGSGPAPRSGTGKTEL